MRRAVIYSLTDEISRETGVSVSDTLKVLSMNMEKMVSRLEGISCRGLPVRYGVMKLDAMVSCHAGFTVVYSQSDMGKTSLLKTMAMNLARQELSVLYIDADCKLYLHQVDFMKGVYFTTSGDLDAARELIGTGLIDVLIVDTISSMPHNSLKAFIFSVKKFVTYIIFSAQMRVDIKHNCTVPACSDSILSLAHTHIYLTESEKITFERLDMRRVQFSIMKYDPDHSLIRARSSFVISDNLVSNFWSSVDYLHSVGMIRAAGQDKFLNNQRIGKYSSVIGDERLKYMMMQMTWEHLGGSATEDLNAFYDPVNRGSLFSVQSDALEGEQDHSPAGEEELEGTYCS